MKKLLIVTMGTIIMLVSLAVLAPVTAQAMDETILDWPSEARFVTQMMDKPFARLAK